MKLAIRYGDKLTLPTVKLGAGIVGYAALHKEAGARARRVDRTALHPGGGGLPVGAGDPACC